MKYILICSVILFLHSCTPKNQSTTIDNKETKVVNTETKVVNTETEVVNTETNVNQEDQNKNNSNIDDLKIWFFHGDVSFDNAIQEYTFYRSINNNAYFKVLNSTHIRLVESQIYLPEKFKILAPMTAIVELEGKISQDNLALKTISYYKQQANIYNELHQKALKPKKSENLDRTGFDGVGQMVDIRIVEEFFSYNKLQWSDYIVDAESKGIGQGKYQLDQQGFLIQMEGTILYVIPYYETFNSPTSLMFTYGYPKINNLTEKLETKIKNRISFDLGKSYNHVSMFYQEEKSTTLVITIFKSISNQNNTK